MSELAYQEKKQVLSCIIHYGANGVPRPTNYVKGSIMSFFALFSFVSFFATINLFIAFRKDFPKFSIYQKSMLILSGVASLAMFILVFIIIGLIAKSLF
ncbi:hypothetical protein [Lactococcus garvieae]|nr:hypothetical protein [Lactococcus garvieae]